MTNEKDNWLSKLTDNWKKSGNKPGQFGTYIDQSVTSLGQTGGITAHTVNFAPPNRQLYSEAQATLLKTVPLDRPVEIEAPSNDAEAERFAGMITGFMRHNGYDVQFSLAMGRPFPEGAEIQVTPEKTFISVGCR